MSWNTIYTDKNVVVDVLFSFWLDKSTILKSSQVIVHINANSVLR